MDRRYCSAVNGRKMEWQGGVMERFSIMDNMPAACTYSIRGQPIIVQVTCRVDRKASIPPRNVMSGKDWNNESGQGSYEPIVRNQKPECKIENILSECRVLCSYATYVSTDSGETRTTILTSRALQKLHRNQSSSTRRAPARMLPDNASAAQTPE